MLNQFSRIELLIGNENLSTLKNKKIAIFGIGGVGGNVCDALARSGIYNFELIDNDTVSITNINRQLVANMDTVGKYKVDIMKDHILSINPQASVVAHKCFVLPDTIDQFDFKGYDYVVDAIDTVSTKIALVEICNKLNVPIISSMGAGNKLNPTMLEVTDIYKTSVCPLARVMRYELKKRRIKHLKVVYSKEQPIKPDESLMNSYKEAELENGSTKTNFPGSSAFVPPVAGIIIASEIVKDLIKMN